MVKFRDWRREEYEVSDSEGESRAEEKAEESRGTWPLDTWWRIRMRAVSVYCGSDRTLTIYLSACLSVCLLISLFPSLTSTAKTTHPNPSHYITPHSITPHYITTFHIPSHHISSHHSTFISPFIATTALTLVVDFGLLMSEFLKRNCLLRLLFSMWSMSVTYTVPPPVSFSPSLSPSLIVLLSIFMIR